MTPETMIVFVTLFFFVLFVIGATKALRRNWIAFLLLLLLLAPVAILWAFIELFIPEAKEEKLDDWS